MPIANIGHRIAVVGCSCAGKSTLAALLAEQLDTTHHELDALHWLPYWTPRPIDKFRQAVSQVTQQESWVIDGNYRQVRDLIWTRATAVVWLDYSLSACLRQSIQRSLSRSWNKELLWGTNRESFWQTFCTPDSVLRWLVQSHGPVRKTVQTDLNSEEFGVRPAIHLRTRQETRAFLARLPKGG